MNISRVLLYTLLVLVDCLEGSRERASRRQRLEKSREVCTWASIVVGVCQKGASVLNAPVKLSGDWNESESSGQCGIWEGWGGESGEGSGSGVSVGVGAAATSQRSRLVLPGDESRSRRKLTGDASRPRPLAHALAYTLGECRLGDCRCGGEFHPNEVYVKKVADCAQPKVGRGAGHGPVTVAEVAGHGRSSNCRLAVAAGAEPTWCREHVQPGRATRRRISSHHSSHCTHTFFIHLHTFITSASNTDLPLVSTRLYTYRQR